jgi:N-acetylmuramoyl-L-alanine amidase
MANRILKFLFIHCSATQPKHKHTAEDVKFWHEQRFGKGNIGYRTIIELNGKAVKMRNANINNIVESDEITFGVSGLNSISHHICYIGGIDNYTMLPTDTRTDEQKKTMESIIKFYIENMNPDILIAPHYSEAKKACPSFHLPDWLESIGIHSKNIYYKDKYNIGHFLKNGVWR